MQSSDDLRQRAKAEAQSAIDSATRALGVGQIDEVAWQVRVSNALAAAYLTDADPRWQSGFNGDADLWRQARELVLAAVDRDGSFLDVGCANGHLMECLDAWSRARGRRLVMYGLELSRDLTIAAKRRLPAMADRIYEGNAIDWEPPCKFTYVRSGLEYVPPSREAPFVARLLRDLVEPGGRLLVGPVADPANALAVLESVAAGRPVTHVATDRNGKNRFVVSVARLLLPNAALLLALTGVLSAQEAALPCQVRGSHQWLSTRPSPLDSAVLVVGNVTAKVCYSRPSARGRSVFESLAPFGKAWRTGANEPTTLQLSAPAYVAGAPLAAGRYLILTVPRPDDWTIVFHTTDATEAAQMFQTMVQVGHGSAKAERLDTPVEQFTIRADSVSRRDLLLEWGDLRVRVPVGARP